MGTEMLTTFTLISLGRCRSFSKLTIVSNPISGLSSEWKKTKEAIKIVEYAMKNSKRLKRISFKTHKIFLNLHLHQVIHCHEKDTKYLAKKGISNQMAEINNSIYNRIILFPVDLLYSISCNNLA